MPQSKSYSKSPVMESRRLTLEEINDKKKRGLCFHCDERFIPGHDCRRKKLYMIMEEQGIDDDYSSEELAIIWEIEDKEPKEKEENDVGISVHAIMGSKKAQTLKIQGQIKNKVISELVDSGSTHNFISMGLVKKLQLPVEACKPFGVTVANGDKLMCTSKSKAVHWRMADKVFITDMNIIPLGGYDLILGVNWMQIVSPITFDFSVGQITINWQNERVVLNQDDRVPDIKVEPIVKENFKCRNEEVYLLVQLTEIGEANEHEKKLKPENVAVITTI